jgi:uncharacterized protein (TIGR03067 family)
VLLCVCVAPFAPGGDAKDGKNDAKKMVGTWKMVTAELAGKAWPEQFIKLTTLVLADGKYTIMVGKAPDEGTWKIDPSKEPRTLDITGTKGPNKGKTFLCIYEFKGDNVRICYDLSGKGRPTEFKTRPDTELFLVEYKRQAP